MPDVRESAAAAVLRFQDALQAGESARMQSLLHADVVLHSPIRFKPYAGREAGGRLLSVIGSALTEISYGDAFVEPGRAVLTFEARATGVVLQGLYLLAFDSIGQATSVTVFLRPASGLEAARVAMATALGIVAPQ